MFLDPEMTHEPLREELDIEDGQAVQRSLGGRSFPRWKVASLLSLTAVLGLLCFVPEVTKAKTGRHKGNALEELVSKSDTYGGLQIQGVDSKKSQAAVQNMQKGFHALGNAFGFGSPKKNPDGRSSFEAAKKSMEKAESSMMNIFGELQKKSKQSPDEQKKKFAKMMEQTRFGSREWMKTQAEAKKKLDASLAKFKNMKFPSHWKRLVKTADANSGGAFSKSAFGQSLGGQASGANANANAFGQSLAGFGQAR